MSLLNELSQKIIKKFTEKSKSNALKHLGKNEIKRAKKDMDNVDHGKKRLNELSTDILLKISKKSPFKSYGYGLSGWKIL